MPACPFCNKTPPKVQKYLGKKIRCPSCRGVFKLPAQMNGASTPVRKPAGDPSSDTLPAGAVAPAKRDKKDRVPRATAPIKKGMPTAVKIAAIVGGLAVLACGGLVAVAFIFGGNPVEFTNTMAQQTGRVDDAWTRVLEAIDAAVEEGPTRAPAVESTRQAALDDVGAIRKEMEAMKVPSMTLADELHAARLAYLKTVEGLLRDDVPEVVELLGDASLTADARASRADSLMKPIGNTIRNASDELLAVQRRYDEAHDLVPVEK